MHQLQQSWVPSRLGFHATGSSHWILPQVCLGPCSGFPCTSLHAKHHHAQAHAKGARLCNLEAPCHELAHQAVGARHSRWAPGPRQRSPSAVAPATEQPYLGSTLLTPHGEEARKGALKTACPSRRNTILQSETKANQLLSLECAHTDGLHLQ